MQNMEVRAQKLPKSLLWQMPLVECKGSPRDTILVYVRRKDLAVGHKKQLRAVHP